MTDMGVLDVVEESIEEPAKAAINGGQLPSQPRPVFVGVVR